MHFDLATLTAGNGQSPHDNDQYGGVRITVPASLDRARPILRVDVSVGDPVTPLARVRIRYPALLGETFVLRGYPLETVLAEKIVTMIDQADTNTRDRDFADVTMLIARHPVHSVALSAAITATARHRGVALRPLAEVLVNLGTDRQRSWEIFRTRTGTAVPGSFEEVIARVIAFVDPVLTGAVRGGVWVPGSAAWHVDPPGRSRPAARGSDAPSADSDALTARRSTRPHK